MFTVPGSRTFHRVAFAAIAIALSMGFVTANATAATAAPARSHVLFQTHFDRKHGPENILSFRLEWVTGPAIDLCFHFDEGSHDPADGDYLTVTPKIPLRQYDVYLYNEPSCNIGWYLAGSKQRVDLNRWQKYELMYGHPIKRIN